MKKIQALLPESEGQNLVLTVILVLSLLADAEGRASSLSSKVDCVDFRKSICCHRTPAVCLLPGR